jgi:small ligand-binding sensory domain FIST
MLTTAAIGEGAAWTEALAAVGLGEGAAAPAPDLALFFASPDYAEMDALVAQAYRRSATSLLIGCTGGGVIGTGREVEDTPAISFLGLNLPGAEVAATHVEMDELAALRDPDKRAWAGLVPSQVNAWVVLADPFSFDLEPLIEDLAAASPGSTIVGGLATGPSNERATKLFLNDRVYESGAIVLALGGAYTVRSVVAQGATPIGEPWTITNVERNVLWTIGNRPALEVLRETIEALPEDQQRRASRNLLVGLAMNEYKDHFDQGDFLIRNLMGADPRSGALAISALPEVGHTIQFQIRDATAADQDLRRQLAAVRDELGDVDVVGALLCTCNGRGIGLFGAPNHDAGAVAEALGPLPLAGFFCNGEVGPVGGQTYIHGFTASLALFVPTSQEG